MLTEDGKDDEEEEEKELENGKEGREKQKETSVLALMEFIENSLSKESNVLIYLKMCFL